MDQNGGSNQNLAHAQNLCRSGCGFYGNSAFEGMCSKCYKDSVKRRNQNPSPTPMGGRMTPTVSATSTSTATPAETAIESRTSVSSVETATPTIPSTSTTQEKNTEKAEGGAEAAVADNNDDGEKDKKLPKKNRCHTCKKKVGLTGFECRCGGLYCGLHRYSDKHECTFDYKELAQQQIRKANPVVVGEKINKI